MSAVVWKLKTLSDGGPLSHFGVVDFELNLYNLATDKLVLTVAGEAANTNPRFAFEQEIELYRDDERWFRGVVTEVPFSEKANGERRQYIVSNPWYFLENVIFMQDRAVLADATRSSIGFASQPVQTTRAVLYQGQTGEHTTAGVQAQVAADFAAARAGPYLGYVPFTRGTFEIDMLAPWESARDVSCAEVIRRCTRWARDCVAWWDYSTDIPQLQIQRRANLSAVTLNIADADRITDYTVGSRPDLQPRGVLFRFQRTAIDEETKAQFVQFEDQPAGDVSDGYRVIVATLVLGGAGAGREEIPDNLATNYYNSLAELQWQGRVTLKERDPSGILKPGVVLNFLGARTAYETMRAVVQSVTVRLATGETIVEFGPSQVLGPQDLLDQARLQLGGAAGSDSTDRFEGTPSGGPQKERENPPSAPPGGSPPSSGSYNAKEVAICEDGQKKKIKVGLV